MVHREKGEGMQRGLTGERASRLGGRGTGSVTGEELGSSSRVVASGACQGSEWALVMQSWLLVSTQ